MSDTQIYKKILSFQKELEKIAEIAWHEQQTSTYIRRHLGKPVWSEKNALIFSLGKGMPIFFRAELDGLNTSQGVRHACGHHAHMAALMGAYLYFKENLPKNNMIYFVFQPSEEGFPSGAQYITDHFTPLKSCKAGFAFHVWPSKKAGILVNAVMAACDYFEIEVEGKGTHVKNKNKVTSSDVLTVAGELVGIINHHRDTNLLINVGTLQGGEVSNALAAQATMTGDVRALTESARKKAKPILEQVIDAILSKTNRVSITLHYFKGYPLLVNNKKIIEKVKELLSVQDHQADFGTEDFSLYPVPSAMIHIGTGKPQELHQVDFTVPHNITHKIFQYWVTLGEKLQL